MHIPSKKALSLLVVPAALAATMPAGKLFAQSQTETKIRLMADALRARDSGDLLVAKNHLEELLKLAPNDPTVKRLLEEVNAQITKGGPAVAYNVSQNVQAEPVEVVYPGDARTVAPSTSEQTASNDAEKIAKDETARLKDLVKESKSYIKQAKALANDERFDEAIAELDKGIQSLPVNALTLDAISDLEDAKNDVAITKAKKLMAKGDYDGARTALEPAEGKSKAKLLNKIDDEELNPVLPPITEASPEFIGEQKEIMALLVKARSQYLAGDLDRALTTYKLVETIDTNNVEAKAFILRIAKQRNEYARLNRMKAREQMLNEINESWNRAGIFVDQPVNPKIKPNALNSLSAKLDSIVIPNVTFTGARLSDVISTLSSASEEFDNSTTGTKGVNMVLTDLSNKDPEIRITLRGLPLKRVLDIITDSVGYQYEVRDDIVIVRPGGEIGMTLDTAFFPVTRATVTRMTGVGAALSSSGSSSGNDPFAAPSSSSGGSSGGGEADLLKAFLQQAGVNFTVEGTSLAYDGSAIIVTQTTRNIDRIRNILNRYNDVKQVEIATKFMEVQEGALDELGVDWTAARRANLDGTYNEVYTTSNRSLSTAFSNSVSTASGVISSSSGTRTIPNAAPTLPGGVDLATDVTSALASITGVIGEFDVSAIVRALARKSGTDLLSEPKVTVLSGNVANIVVAQELRYPQSYSDTQSQVGSSSSTSSSSGSAGVTVTPGTPQDFTMRNVGVELRVTPTVEDDDYSISLDLNPRVTEFEGFVEYGGQSVAISSGITVTMPSGFYQPIFSTREVNTRVTVWDGATLVLGGLTREEVKKVDDKVPILGDIPLLGRAFRSKGESSQKRNLLIFVTANLVSPGGSPKKQNLEGVPASSMFQNPSVVTPGSSANRRRTTATQ